MTRESDIEKYLIKRVKEADGEIRKVKWIGRRGCPDRLVGFKKDTAGFGFAPIFVELKAPGKKLAAHQKREIKKLGMLGVATMVIDSKKQVDILVGYCTDK